MCANGEVDLDRLKDLVRAVDEQKLALGLSCRKKELRWYCHHKYQMEDFSIVMLTNPFWNFLPSMLMSVWYMICLFKELCWA